MKLTLCIAVVVAGFLPHHVGAQTRLFLALPDQEALVVPGVSHTLFVAPGTTLTLEAWIDDAENDLLGSYQIAFLGNAAPVGSIGSVSYVDTAPPGGSIVVAPGEPAWVFATQQPSAFYSEALPAGFAVLVFLPTGQGVDVTGLGYLGEFQMDVGPNTAGTFIIDFLPQGAPPHGGTSLTAADGLTEIPFTVQRLFIIVEPPPPNDTCSNATAIGIGSVLFNNTTASDDPPLDSFGGLCTNDGNPALVKDLWYEYTAPCDAQLTLSTCDGAAFDTRIEVYDGCGTCPPADLLACNDDGAGCADGTSTVNVGVSAGTCYTIRVGTPDPLTVGTGTLKATLDRCVIGGICHAAGASNPTNECQVCDLVSPTAWTARRAGAACGNATVSACDGPDTCDGAGQCNLNHVVNNAPCNDGLICTTPDRCQTGLCIGTPVDCDDGFPCTTDACQEGTGCDSTIDAGFCLFDVCYADGTELPDLPCHFCLVAFSQTEVTVVDDGPGCSDDCTTPAECIDGNADGVTDDACLFADCIASTCDLQPRAFGDAGGAFGACPPDGFANVHDRNHILGCFTQTNPCAAINVDLGGAFGACAPDGFCNIHDVNHTLAAFSQTTTCTCPGGPAPIAPPPIVGVTALVLETGGAPGERIAVDVLAAQPLDELRGYQLELAPGLTAVDITIEARPDAAFAGRSDRFAAFNPAAAQMLCGVEGRGVATPAGAYLATFWFDAPMTPTPVDIATAGQTFLIGRDGGKITIPETRPAVVEPARRPGIRRQNVRIREIPGSR